MTWLKTLIGRIRALFDRPRLEDELEREVSFHLEMEEAENIRRGMTAEEARCAARRSFGGVDVAKEAWRDRRWLPQVDQWLREARLGLRFLARSPGFVAIAVLSLALGIGANTAIFAALRALVVQPLPYPEPHGLVKLWEAAVWQGHATTTSVSVPNLRDWREQSRSFEGMAAFSVEGANLGHRDGAIRLLASQVEPGVFPILRTEPLAGRVFLPEEGESGATAVVVLSYGLWERSFNSDRGIIGQTIAVNGTAHTVVGVMPAGFHFPPRTAAELWTPLAFGEAWHQDRGSHWVQVIARLKPGVSWVSAQLELNEIARRLEKQYPKTNATRGARVEALHLETVRATAQVLIVLAGAVGFVLLLACANVAHLVLARGAGRRRELAVRLALGASRWRVVRLLTMESLLLAAAGGVAGFIGGRWCLDAMVALAGDEMPPGVTVALDASTVWFCAFASLGSAVLAGLVPALRLSRVDVSASLKEAGSSSAGALRSHRSFLMVSEVALALVLAAGALLLVKSLRVLNRIDFGFRPERVLTMKISLPEHGYSKPAKGRAFFRELTDQIRAMPGVSSVGTVNFLPVQFCCANLMFSIDGRADAPLGSEPAAELRVVDNGYLQTMGIPLVVGRYLNEGDRAASTNVVLISRRTADEYFPNENPVGRSIRYGLKRKDGVTIVGVVGDVRDRGVYRGPSTVIYEPHEQSDWPWTNVSVVVRSSLEPTTLANAVTRLVRGRDPNAAMFLVKTMHRVVSDSVAGTRLLTKLLTVFGALALLLSVAGVYGVMSHLVSQRTHEIGVRMALGAGRGEVVRMVLARGLWNALVGASLGLGLTFMASAGLRAFVIGIHVVDVSTYLQAVAGIIAAALVASGLPAFRAARVDPLIALRDE
jgi:predicted permease